MVGQTSDTETHGYLDSADGFCLDLASDAFGYGEGFLHGMVSQYEANFLPAVSVYTSFALSDPLQQLRNHSKDGVTGLVAVGVVYLLKVIDVAKHQAERLILAYCVADCLSEGGIERSAVEELRQVISCFQGSSVPAACCLTIMVSGRLLCGQLDHVVRRPRD